MSNITPLHKLSQEHIRLVSDILDAYEAAWTEYNKAPDLSSYVIGVPEVAQPTLVYELASRATIESRARNLATDFGGRRKLPIPLHTALALGSLDAGRQLMLSATLREHGHEMSLAENTE